MKTKIPGPYAKKIVNKTHKYATRAYTWAYPLAVKKAFGMYVEDVDGNVFLDFTSGVGVNSLGHSHPRVVDAIFRQSNDFIHMAGADFYYPEFAELCEKLHDIVPIKGRKSVFLCNSGTEAIEAAIKLARNYTKRPRMIATIGGFHGRTMGSLSLTASKAIQRKNFSPLLPEVIHIPYPYEYRPVFGSNPDNITENILDYLENTVFKKLTHPDDVSCIVIEAIQGEGGYVVAPKEFLKGLRKICDKYGILLILDEVQAGCGRTGKWWAFEHSSIEPDIVAIGKGIASGLPLGATVSKAKINKWEKGAHANTFGGNPLACESALIVIDEVNSHLKLNASKIGKILNSRLKKLMIRNKNIGDVRGIGLMQAIEIVKSKKERVKAPLLATKIMNKCFENGLLLLTCGDSSIRFIPSLTVTEDEIDKAMRVLDSVVRKIR